MASTSRTFAVIPPATAEVLAPVLSDLADETIAAIAVEVPDYARAMEGEFGRAVRRGVEIAFLDAQARLGGGQLEHQEAPGLGTRKPPIAASGAEASAVSTGSDGRGSSARTSPSTATATSRTTTPIASASCSSSDARSTRSRTRCASAGSRWFRPSSTSRTAR